MTSEVVIVHTMMGSDWTPVRAITARSRPKPRRMTAHCRTFFETKAMPEPNALRTSGVRLMTMPARMAKMGPPITGNACPSSHAGTAIARQNRMPGPLSLRNSTSSPFACRPADDVALFA